jgi:hypothetical protein
MILHIKVTIKPVDNLLRLFTQGIWYGRNLLGYLSKTMDLLPLVGILIYTSFLPLLVLSFLKQNFLILFLFDTFLIVFHIFKKFLSTLNPYAFLILPYNIIKGLGELIGPAEYMVNIIKEKIK